MVWHCQAGTGAWCDIVTWGDIGDMIKPWFPGLGVVDVRVASMWHGVAWCAHSAWCDM